MNDKDLLQELGGPVRVAKLLGVSPQAVCNWKVRGIPAHIKVRFPDLFLIPRKETLQRIRKSLEPQKRA